MLLIAIILALNIKEPLTESDKPFEYFLDYDGFYGREFLTARFTLMTTMSEFF